MEPSIRAPNRRRAACGLRGAAVAEGAFIGGGLALPPWEGNGVVWSRETRRPARLQGPARAWGFVDRATPF
jgi:hypothetical protein